ncbi:MAG: hypothetical protein M1821_001648 [Bathelium mastoideum]|nr:MAG: hypothetical protein M1821_001648 [Bathelium mastoideum]
MAEQKIQELIAVVQKEAKAQADGEDGAHIRLLGAAEKLKSAIETPAEFHVRYRFQFLQNYASRILLELGVLDALCSRKEAVTAAELAKETGADELLICRLMRLLTPIGYADEIAENTYAANDKTRFANQPAFKGAEKHHFTMYTEVGVKLIGYMRSGGGIHQFPDASHMVPPYPYTHDGKTLWEVHDEDSEQKADFDLYMSSRRQGALAPEWWETYPAAVELPTVPGGLKTNTEAVLLVDVAGGRGHDLEKFRQKHPDLPGRCILQDLPSTIQDLKDHQPKGCEMHSYDFFTPQPIKGARAYFFRDIGHDWSDEQCRRLFGNTVAAMDKDYSRILIDDFVLPTTGTGVRAASMDIHMLFTLAGIERTEAHWHRLLDSIGLEVIKIWPGSPGMHESVIEAKKR